MMRWDTLWDILDVLLAIAAAIFALGAIAGASMVLIVAGLFDRWDRAERKS